MGNKINMHCKLCGADWQTVDYRANVRKQLGQRQDKLVTFCPKCGTRKIEIIETFEER